MPDESPQISFREEWRCDGYLSLGGINARSNNVYIRRTKYDHSAKITFSALFERGSTDQIAHFVGNSGLRFSSKLYGDVALTGECLALSADGMTLEGVVRRLDIGIEPLSVKVVERQTVQVQFTPTHMAQPAVRNLVRHWTGEIKALSEERERELMRLDTPIGRATFSQYFHWETAYVQDVHAVVQVPVPTLSVDVDDGKRTPDIGSLVNALAEYLVSFEALLSFLSRRQVRWTEIEVITEGKADLGTPVSAARHLRNNFGSREPPDPLIVPARLGPRDLDDLLKRLLASQYKGSVEVAVNYLNSRWGREFIESKLVSAFTAFETLVNGIDSMDGTDVTLSTPLFRSLRKELEREIKRFSIEHGVAEARAEMYTKLGELQRRPIIPRAVSILKRYRVRWNDLWTDNANLQDALNELYRRRGTFIHAGRIDNYGDAISDTERLHTLAERLVYNLVGGKTEWLHPFAYPNRR